MISSKDMEIFRKQFDMVGEANDEELFMALARERLRLRTNKKTCESNPVSKSICVNKETPLPQQVIGKIISRNVIGYKKGVYIGKIGIAMLTTPLGKKFIIFKEVKGYTQISTLKRLSIWCFDAQQPLKFHKNSKNYYIREADQIWWRLNFRTDAELTPFLNIIDGVNIKMINKLPTNMNVQVEQTKLISKITNPSIEDPRLKKIAKKAARATKKLKVIKNEATQVEADSTQNFITEENIKPEGVLFKKEIEGTSEAEVKIEPDLSPHALIGPDVKHNINKSKHGSLSKGKMIKKKSTVIKTENDVMETCSPRINARKVKTDDSETDMEANEKVARIETKIKNKKNSKETKQKSGKSKKKSVAQANAVTYEKKDDQPSNSVTFAVGNLPSTQNFFGKEDFQQSNKPKQCIFSNSQTIKGTKSFSGFPNYVYQLQDFKANSIDARQLENKQILSNSLEYKKLCLLLNIGLGKPKTTNFRDAVFGNEQKNALLCEFLKRLKATFIAQQQQQQQNNENTSNMEYNGHAEEETQCRQQFQKEYLQCLMENLKI